MIARIALAFAALAAVASAQERVENLSLSGNPTEYVGFEPKPGTALPRGLALRDERGQPVELAGISGDKPMLFALVYYACPRLCSEVLQASVRTMRALELELGRDYDFVALSIDPTETPELAMQKLRSCAQALARPGTDGGWHFLTGDQRSIERVTSACGFRYVFDEASRSYAHDGGILVVSPAGVVTHGFFNLEYPPSDVRLALVESSRGRLGSILDHVVLLCFHYDPALGKYGFAVVGALRIFAALTAVGLFFYIVRGFLRDRRAAGARAVP
jgi:protein SCO1/2